MTAAEIIKDLEGVTPEMLEAAARLPPQLLLDMRAIYEEEPPKTAQQRVLSESLRRNPDRFFDRLMKAENEYREQMIRLGPAQAANVPETDEGTEMALEMMEQWLREHGVKS